MSAEYDTHIAVRPTGPGRLLADLADGWRVGGGINGGYLLAVVGNALRASLPHHPDPLVISAYYLSAATSGPAEITTRVLQSGSRTTVAAELSQGGVDRLAALATYGTLHRLPDEVETTAVEPVLPPPEQCVRNTTAAESLLRLAPLMRRFDMLFDPACAGWVRGEPSGGPMLRAWYRLNDGRQPDPIALLTAVDALPPVTFALGRFGWAPTLELTAHIRAEPAPGWLKLRQHTRNIAGGMFEEDCEVWDSAGRLVAQSRQLALFPRFPVTVA